MRNNKIFQIKYMQNFCAMHMERDICFRQKMVNVNTNNNYRVNTTIKQYIKNKARIEIALDIHITVGS